MSETLWKRDKEQLPSVKTLLGELQDDVTVLDVPEMEGVEQIAWVMKKVLLPLEGMIVEIGIDATCRWPSSITHAALTRHKQITLTHATWSCTLSSQNMTTLASLCLIAC